MTGARADPSLVDREYHQLGDEHPPVEAADLVRIGLVALAIFVVWTLHHTITRSDY